VRFNTGAYNRSSFNLTDTLSSEVHIRAVLAEAFDAHITRGVNVYLADHFNEEFDAAVAGALGHYIAAEMGEAFLGAANLAAHYLISETLAETFTGQAAGAVDLHLVGALSETVGAWANGARNWYVSLEMFEQTQHYARLSRVWYPGETKFSEVFFALASTDVFEYLTIEVDTLLPAGSSLVIDAEDYSVRLDGKNIIHAHSGDWLYMSRDIYDISVATFAGRTAAQAGLNVRALYIERYL